MTELPDSLVGKTLVDVLYEQATVRPNALALTAVSARTGEERISYGQLVHRASRLAAALRDTGVAKGSHVAVMANNDAGIEAAITMVALHFLGAVFVPVNTRFADEEVTFVLNKARCTTLVVMREFLPRVERIRETIPAVEHIVSIGGDAPGFASDWHVLFEAARAPTGRWPSASTDDVSEILFTSGTTARPKGAVMTHGRTVVSAYGFADAMSLGETDVFESFFPFFTTAATHCVLLPCWWAGAQAVVDPELDISAIIRRMERERTTKYIGSPSFYLFLLDAFDSKTHDLSHMKMFDFGGASMAPEVIRRLLAQFPATELRQTFGMTESGPAGTVFRGWEHPEQKLGSVGRPWALTEVRVVSEQMADLPVGELGEIALQSPSTMREYFDEPGLSQGVLRDGWYLTGDLGYLDADGFLYHVDRKKDMIIRGGHNIGSLEVEEVFFRHPAILDVAVIAVPHPKLGEDIHAFAVLRPGRSASVDDLRSFCTDKLADYKIPRRVTFVDAMPRGPMGKVLKSELRQIAAASREKA